MNWSDVLRIRWIPESEAPGATAIWIWLVNMRWTLQNKNTMVLSHRYYRREEIDTD
jgi:hypothetical protein